MKPRTSTITRSIPLLLVAALPLRGAEPTLAGQPEKAADVIPTPPPGGSLSAPPTALSTPTEPPPPGAQGALAPVGPSRNFSINLVKRLVERGALTQRDAEELIALADADTALAAAAPAPVPAPAPAPAPLPGDVRVTYVPETVRNRIRDEVRDQLKSEAKTEGWYGDKDAPSWTKSVDPFVDFRARYQFDTYADGNDNTGAFPNFNAINTGSPFDVAGTQFSPQYNVDQNRQRARLRFRAGAEFDLEDDFTLGFRVGTGQDNSPVSSNQSLGYAGGAQGGNFSKYAIWLDRAFVGWEPNAALKITVGRFDNPFFATPTIWSEDIGFDGLAVNWKSASECSVQPFFTGGAFPIFNTELNFSSNRPDKFASTDKWLYAAQLGSDFKLGKEVKTKLAVAFYDFQNVEGVLSSPYTPLSPDDAGSTDGTRPSFAQKGNTYRPLRNIVPTSDNDFGTKNQWQYFGLATPFRVLATTGRIDYTGFDPVQLSLVAEYAKNVAFDQNAINAVAVNNRGAGGAFDGSDTAWYLNFIVGHPALDARGNWQAFAGYRHVGSDAVVDGFNDQDFGGGGTNMEGFTAGFSYSLSKRTRIGSKWFSADQIAGPPLGSDIIMLDFGAKF